MCIRDRVIGGGNIYRGIEAQESGINRVQGDYMGMLATLINSMALQSHLEKLGCDTRLMSGFNVNQVCEPFIRRKAIRHLQKRRIVIFGAGLGKPYFTTDSTASLRAIEIEANIVLKGTRVDGVYSSDPEKNKDAIKFEELSFNEAYEKNLNIMDMTASGAVNDGFRFAFVAVDICTKLCHAVPIKDKEPEESIRAMKEV